MIKVLQYGEGNFLRAFVDAYFQTLNEEKLGEYGVHIVKPAHFGSMDKFKKQDNKYHVILRGMEKGKAVERVLPISCVQNASDPFTDDQDYYALAEDSELKIIVSNTTEAGIRFNETDKIEGFAEITYPAKLTKFLYRRYQKGLGGVYLLPVELIDHNADELKRCVDEYIKLWNLPAGFQEWNDTQNYYCNTLVDRIVSGYPKDEQTKTHLQNLIGEQDELMTVGEPFGLWVIQEKGDLGSFIPSGFHNVEVILTDDIGYYKKRKVRVLNGSHTNLVATGIWLGEETVYDCMQNEKLLSFVENTLTAEINPFVSSDLQATEKFAKNVKDRFSNPYLNHQLTSIALNSISKWRARNLPSFQDYYAVHGVPAPLLTIGFSYLMALYSAVEKAGDLYLVSLKNRTVEIKDDEEYLEYFASKKDLGAFLKDESVWGEDVTKYEGFEKTVKENVERIQKGICLI